MDDVAKLITAIQQTVDAGGIVFVAGNGGSASTADHFVNDLIARRIPAVSLTSNTSLLTMIANDYGYEYVFSKQLEVLASKNDLVVLISCSGTSPNIVEAVKLNFKTITIFGGIGTYGDKENEHLRITHSVVEGIGEKCL